MINQAGKVNKPSLKRCHETWMATSFMLHMKRFVKRRCKCQLKKGVFPLIN